MPEQNENKELTQLSNKFAKELEKMRNEEFNNIEAPIHLNNNEANYWIMGYQMGYQQAIEYLNMCN